jgi:2-polyprenyl-3-methyl-5-hydroxy-6-metoxy-1,4-benzoquinol methylase
MPINSARHCPLCDAKASGITFPYITIFNAFQFNYLKCGACYSVFVDPVPDSQTFAKMYAKAAYHDCNYEAPAGWTYSDSAKLLQKYLPVAAKVMDYGCGTGDFLKALAQEGFIPYGVEFDENAARFAAQNANCETFSVEHFLALNNTPKYDAMHLGDVLEHLPDPGGQIKLLLACLKPDGLLFVEGPLEINPSPVYWASRLFGTIKRILSPNTVGRNAPTHLFRTGAKQQLDFFQLTEPHLQLISWTIYETGWPYADGGIVKRAIAGIALLIGGKKLFGITFGNRFRGLFRYRRALADSGITKTGIEREGYK